MLQQFLSTASLVALVLQYLGLLAERWFFFAQANPPQNLYYQEPFSAAPCSAGWRRRSWGFQDTWY